ncbi:hypothetical protein ACTXL6_16520 [Brachybacterium tyrofermentans]|uniref:hypothetical protein n=1 Tax=Brachybacterium tyrofermentans TaxID=47848 RepID=UPI003FCF754E
MSAKEVNLREKLGRNAASSKPTTSAAIPTSPAPIPPGDEDDLVRKEIRVRPEQVTALASLRRRINKARTAAEKGLDASEKSPSMTDRILTRVALDYLLEHEDDLQGWTEQDLLTSLRNAKD